MHQRVVAASDDAQDLSTDRGSSTVHGTSGRHARPGASTAPWAPARRRRAHARTAAASPWHVVVPGAVVTGALASAVLLGAIPVGAAPGGPTLTPAARATSAPWSATSTPSSSAATSQAAALPTLPKDPAAAAKLIDALKPRIAAASTAFTKASRELDAAERAVVAANQHAIQAERLATQARDTLAGWAGYLYRTTGSLGLMSQLLDAVGDDPTQFLRAAGDAAVVADGLAFDVARTQRTVVESHEATLAASLTQSRAQAAAAAAERARGGLQTLLGQAQALVNSSQGAAGPQTLITAAGCPTTVPANTLRDGSASVTAFKLCSDSVKQAATPQAALAIQAAFRMLGAPYACKGEGRMDPFRFDCSSLVSRAYYLGAGLNTAGATWAPSTRDMVPWDGVPLADWASYVAPKFVRPGDLVLYDTGGAAYRHVVMYLAGGFQLHTNSCGDVAHVSAFSGFGISPGHAFLVARRVLAPGGVRVPDPVPVPTRRPIPGKPAPGAPGAGDPRVITPAPTPVPGLPVPTAPVTGSPSPTGSVSTTPAPSGSATTTPPPAGGTTSPPASSTPPAQRTSSPPPTSPSTTAAPTSAAPTLTAPVTPAATTPAG